MTPALTNATDARVQIPPMSLPPVLRGTPVSGADDSHWISNGQGRVVFSIQEVIGEGGMGIVYRATQEYPSRVVALKVLKASVADSDFVRRFKREIDIFSRINHRGT